MVTAERAMSGANRAATLRRLEPVWAFLGALAFYASLHGELPYHDVYRFIAQIEGGAFVWDMGHVWLQPVTLLWHWYLGFGESAETSQWHINAVFAAAGVAVFYWSLVKFERPAWQRIVAAALVAASCNILTLAPTAHMKLLALPFLTGSFHCAVSWERDRALGRARAPTLVWSGALMALAASFHSSCLAAPPFVGLVILVASVRHGDGWAKGLGRAALYGLVAGLLFLVSLEIARVAFFHELLTPDNFAATVGDKNGLRTGWFSWSDLAGRLVFGTVNNFVAAPELGPVVRAWLLHQIPSLVPYAKTLLLQAVPFLATLALLAAVYLRGAWRAWRGRGLAMPLAFVAGSLAWNAFFNINEPEHWFHLTVPTVFLALTAFEGRTLRWLLPLWALPTVALNLALWAVPEARYPLKRYEAQLRQDYGQNDLFLYFVTYGGGPNLSFFKLDTPHVALDQRYEDSKDDTVFFPDVAREIDAALARGGQVVVWGALDPENWNAPWMLLTRDGLTKAKLTGFFYGHYRVEQLGEIAEIKAWRLAPLPPAAK